MFKKFTAFDQIPKDAQKDALELKDGTWVIAEAPADLTLLQASVATLEQTVKNIRREKDDAVALAAINGSTAAEAKRLLEAKEASGQQTDVKIADMLKKWEADTAAAVATAVEKKDREIGLLSERVTKYDLDDVLVAAFKESGGRDDRAKRAIAQAKLDGWTLVDGKAVKKDSSGTVLTISAKEFFTTDMKKELPEWYDGTKGDGGGGTGGGGANGSAFRKDGSPKNPTAMTTDERREFIEQNGPAAYTKLLNESLATNTNSPAK